MTYFEFLIATFTGLHIEKYISGELKFWDRFALRSAEVSAVLLVAFSIVIVSAILIRVFRMTDVKDNTNAKRTTIDRKQAV